MDDEQPQTGMSGSLSVVRAVVVLAVFVAAVALLVDVGTRPSVSSLPGAVATTVPTTTPTTAGAGASSTTTTAAHSSTTTTAAHGGHGHKGSKSTTTTTTIAPGSVSVVVANATSVNGLAAHYTTVIGAGGWKMGTPIDAATTEATSAVYYASGFQEPAASIATTIGVKPTQVLPLTTATPVSGVTGVDVVVVIGADLASTTTTTT
ncbi:MAG: LytR C-terminal domain-containing protein [Acidimicrobiales bacterium]|jgi:hypothetical protein